jgi:ubiquinone/menaquinone biosynthesis C-methylase UbiE
MAAAWSRLMHFILKIFYKLLYHQMAWTYDWVAWLVSVGLWQEWVHSVLPYIEGNRLLEIGHGPGHLQETLLKKKKVPESITGLDKSPQMTQSAHQRLMKEGLTSRLVNGDAQNLPFAAGAFDQVVATFPSEYIASPETLSGIWRVLAPDGSLVVLLGAWITGKGLRERAAAALFRITGQAPNIDDRATDPARRAGFETRIEWIHLKTSTLAVVIASKNPSN